MSNDVMHGGYPDSTYQNRARRRSRTLRRRVTAEDMRATPMERLVDKSISASVFAPEANDRTLPARVRTVVIGAGIVGTSTAYHLTELGDSDVLVLERNVLGSGTTWHAAGLTAGVRGTPAMTELAAYSINKYPGLGAVSGVDVSFNQCGSITVARTSSRVDELRYTAAVARQHNIPATMISADQVTELWPLASSRDVV